MEIIKKYMKDNMIIQIPKKNKDKLTLLSYVTNMFETGTDYSESEINFILKSVYNDYALLRRYIIDFRFMERSKDGKSYRINLSDRIEEC